MIRSLAGLQERSGGWLWGQGTVSGWGHTPGEPQALPAAGRSLLGPSEDLRCGGEVAWGREHPAS